MKNKPNKLFQNRFVAWLDAWLPSLDAGLWLCLIVWGLIFVMVFGSALYLPYKYRTTHQTEQELFR